MFPPDPTPPRTPVELDGGVGLERPREIPNLRRASHEAMHTVYEVYAVHPDPQYVAQAAQAAFDLVDRLEQELSRFRGNSDITRVNHLEPGEQIRVGTATIECLVIAQHLFRLTGGTFDIAIGTGLPSLELDVDASTVRATRSGVRVDLGGIGKGYAVDLVAELLEEWDLTQAMVHGGFSSMVALDPPEGREGWPLTLSDPGDASRVLEQLSVRQTALSASGIRKRDHIVDPRSGRAVRGRRGAWVTMARPAPVPGGPRLAAGAVADALTTAFMLLDAPEIEAICAASPGLTAWILPAAGDLAFGSASVLRFGGTTGRP
jgi:thiamine biosynthesis lipoprotein